MEDVARAVGYSRAAVSMALRGDPTIPEKTRQRITTVAQRLGYRTNPLISSLMSLQRQRRPVMGITTTVAYLTLNPRRASWRKRDFYLKMYRGAEQCLAEAGCRLEEFGLRFEGMNPLRLQQIFRARNIHAAIIAPLPHGETDIDFDFTRLAVVGLGMSVHSPVIERVANDHFQSAALAVENCVALGYRRIGFVLSQESSRRLDHRWLAGFRFALSQCGLEATVPLLMTEAKEQLIPALRPWLREHRPDVVLLGNAELELQVQIPLNLGMVSLGVDQAEDAMSGIYQNYTLLGRVAAEHALAKLHTNNFGPLTEAHLHLVAGQWVAGSTAPGPKRRRPAVACVESETSVY